MKKQVVVSTVSVRALSVDGVLSTKTFKAYGKISQSKAVKMANEKFNGNIIVPSVAIAFENVSVEVVLPELV